MLAPETGLTPTSLTGVPQNDLQGSTRHKQVWNLFRSGKSDKMNARHERSSIGFTLSV